jgi:SpoIID/LytB domain protein
VEAKHYMNVISYTWSELQEITAQEDVLDTNKEDVIKEPEIQNTESTEASAKNDKETQNITTEQQVKQQDIQVTEVTENGFVKKISVDGIIYTGEEAMERYGLSSMNFYVEDTKDGVRFVCLGKGNCLGVSQYGANWMAIQGSTFDEIIRHYYGKIGIESFKS